MGVMPPADIHQEIHRVGDRLGKVSEALARLTERVEWMIGAQERHRLEDAARWRDMEGRLRAVELIYKNIHNNNHGKRISAVERKLGTLEERVARPSIAMQLAPWVAVLSAIGTAASWLLRH